VDCPVVSIGLPQLGALQQIELWSSADPVHMTRQGDLCVATTEEAAVAVLFVEEEPGVSLDRTTYHAYRRLLTGLQQRGYPHLWRAWNYFPRINGDEEGLERYQRFCVGRHQALAEALPDFPASLPAATAVGTQSGPLQIILLAGSAPGRHLGNPRQVNAYDYPAHYGPRSPSFARGTVSPTDGESNLFIAGTASVVGHASRHTGLPREQTQETIDNLRALLHHTDSLTGAAFETNMPRGIFKVYLRRPDDLPVVSATLQEASFAPEHLLFLQGELCRRELLVEIEGVVPAE
jgi:chorismate lyase/3-hydroxybenzoate synthase